MSFNFNKNIQPADNVSCVDLRAQVLMVNKALAGLHNRIHASGELQERGYNARCPYPFDKEMSDIIIFNEDTGHITYNPSFTYSFIEAGQYYMAYLLYMINKSYNSCIEPLLPYFHNTRQNSTPRSLPLMNEHIHESYIVKALDNTHAHYIDFDGLEFILRLWYQFYHDTYKTMDKPYVILVCDIENFASLEQCDVISKYWMVNCPTFLRKNRKILKHFKFDEYVCSFLFNSLAINPYSEPFSTDKFQKGNLYTQLAMITEHVQYTKFAQDF